MTVGSKTIVLGPDIIPTSGFGLFLSDAALGTSPQNILAEFRGLLVFVTADQIDSALSEQEARKHALDLWNSAVADLAGSGPFPIKARNVLLRLKDLVKRKAFLERRIHRYIAEHHTVILPHHVGCYPEHELVLGTEKRIADFVLENPPTIPSLLIELENPIHRLLRKNGEPTSEAQHAGNQIAEWISFVERDSRNVEGKFAFLAGPKSGLVVIGRGQGLPPDSPFSRIDRTLFWTYDQLALEACKSWNAIIEAQSQLVGLKNPQFIRIGTMDCE